MIKHEQQDRFFLYLYCSAQYHLSGSEYLSPWTAEYISEQNQHYTCMMNQKTTCEFITKLVFSWSANQNKKNTTLQYTLKGKRKKKKKGRLLQVHICIVKVRADKERRQRYNTKGELRKAAWLWWVLTIPFSQHHPQSLGGWVTQVHQQSQSIHTTWHAHRAPPIQLYCFTL